MTRTEAIAYIASCGEDDGPEDRDEAAEIFLALFGVEPDADDDHLMVWSHCCAWREDGVS